MLRKIWAYFADLKRLAFWALNCAVSLMTNFHLSIFMQFELREYFFYLLVANLLGYFHSYCLDKSALLPHVVLNAFITNWPLAAVLPEPAVYPTIH